MYIFFINSNDKCDIFFLLNLIIIVIKKKFVQPMGSTRPNPTHIGWVGLNFFFTHHGGLGQKISLTQPMHTLNGRYRQKHLVSTETFDI